jgi:hypothetical protein
MMMLKPYCANAKAKALPIPMFFEEVPSEEPVINTQLFWPYRALRFLRGRARMKIFFRSEYNDFKRNRAPINYKVREN